MKFKTFSLNEFYKFAIVLLFILTIFIDSKSSSTDDNMLYIYIYIYSTLVLWVNTKDLHLTKLLHSISGKK